MSVCSEITTDATADAECPKQREQYSYQNGNMNSNRDKSPTCIVTDPDSDIETDAVPSAPRPRGPQGTPFPEPPKPKSFANDESNEEFREKNTSFSDSNTKTGKVPGFFKDKVPWLGGTRVMYNVCNSHNVHFGNNIMFGTNFKQPMGSHEKEEEASPPKYEILMSSKKVVTDEHLDCVADNIGKNWKKLGNLLGMKEAAIFRFEDDYKNDHRERVYQLLLEWKQSTGGPNQAPLLVRLSAALWQLRERDALDSLVRLETDPRLNSQ